MKAFFKSLHLGGSRDKDRDNNSTTKDKEKDKFPPLPSWPPQEAKSASVTSTPASLAAFKPLPDIAPSQIAAQIASRPLPSVAEPSTSTSTQLSESQSSTTLNASPKVTASSSQGETKATESSTNNPESTGRSSRKANTSNGTNGTADVQQQKKVAFISPPPTPVNVDRALPESPTSSSPPQPTAPLKTTVSRFQAVYGKEPRGSVSTGASSSKTDVATVKNTPVKATSTRTASPYMQKSFDGPSAQSLRSGTPYSSMSQNTSGSRILAATSWSEVTEDDLVSNIGSRERTRQEVLFEIIQSEERYVQELVKMKDTFIDPLLHPYSNVASASTTNVDYDYYRTDSPFESADDLPPIAARFMSPTPSMNPPLSTTTSPRPREAPNIDSEFAETDDEDDYPKDVSKKASGSSRDNHNRSPYRSTVTRTGGRSGGTSVPFPSRSHASLPPPVRNQLSASTHSLGRQSTVEPQEREKEKERDRSRKYSQGRESPNKGMLRKFKKSQTSAGNILGNAIAPHQLPEDLRICLEVIDGGVFEGHKRLSEALKKRYDDQYPLVRSLADVFVSNSDIFKGYATYVLHLERALEQVDAALSNTSTKKPKKQDAGDWQKVCKALRQLEENSAEKGETGLAITLSKPFQRLLKYPLLFQNLLFHTDPSTFEYESTLQMVAEVENIVRSIEDEKIQKEERDKTRDVFARIEGLDKVRQLALPKSSRVLIEERQCNNVSGSPKLNSPPPVVNAKGVRGKSSFKRLSDVLRSDGVGGKKDLWFVVFNDVVLQCQRTGTTSLPIVASTTSRTNSLPELQGKTKYATTGRRHSTTRPRNMYKFIKIETWAIGDVLQPREGIISMEDMAKSRVHLNNQPRIVPMPDDDEPGDGSDSDDSDKKSKMSFSYWGADKITVQKPMLKGRSTPQPRRSANHAAAYGRESSANAKFGSRLVSDSSQHSTRPASRRTTGGATTPTSRRTAPSEESPNYARATITRPAWGSTSSTRTPLPGKRPRNSSQASASTRTPLGQPSLAKSPVASPAPSEDSGVGMYRQLLANDPSLNNSA
ncbi:hypothetical protein CPB83DRAFT_667377 [Crepidotus variabilis]|uniref:DH domain-containing protein n=1 Tax=Crepidotus variabilis TaxID=179855 RepID=A0A9P6EPD3_9AGAR|nr:hypothetical protein CPB83DRAFT_667377 [Crepidotus variabilis]